VSVELDFAFDLCFKFWLGWKKQTNWGPLCRPKVVQEKLLIVN